MECSVTVTVFLWLGALALCFAIGLVCWIVVEHEKELGLLSADVEALRMKLAESGR